MPEVCSLRTSAHRQGPFAAVRSVNLRCHRQPSRIMGAVGEQPGSRNRSSVNFGRPLMFLIVSEVVAITRIGSTTPSMRRLDVNASWTASLVLGIRANGDVSIRVRAEGR